MRVLTGGVTVGCRRWRRSCRRRTRRRRWRRHRGRHRAASDRRRRPRRNAGVEAVERNLVRRRRRRAGRRHGDVVERHAGSAARLRGRRRCSAPTPNRLAGLRGAPARDRQRAERRRAAGQSRRLPTVRPARRAAACCTVVRCWWSRRCCSTIRRPRQQQRAVPTTRLQLEGGAAVRAVQCSQLLLGGTAPTVRGWEVFLGRRLHLPDQGDRWVRRGCGVRRRRQPGRSRAGTSAALAGGPSAARPASGQHFCVVDKSCPARSSSCDHGRLRCRIACCCRVEPGGSTPRDDAGPPTSASCFGHRPLARGGVEALLEWRCPPLARARVAKANCRLVHAPAATPSIARRLAQKTVVTKATRFIVDDGDRGWSSRRGRRYVAACCCCFPAQRGARPDGGLTSRCLSSVAAVSCCARAGGRRRTRSCWRRWAVPVRPFEPAGSARLPWRLDRRFPAYTSLVPAQVARMLDSPPNSTLRAYEAVLLGSTRASAGVADAAQVAAIRHYRHDRDERRDGLRRPPARPRRRARDRPTTRTASAGSAFTSATQRAALPRRDQGDHRALRRQHARHGRPRPGARRQRGRR